MSKIAVIGTPGPTIECIAIELTSRGNRVLTVGELAENAAEQKRAFGIETFVVSPDISMDGLVPVLRECDAVVMDLSGETALLPPVTTVLETARTVGIRRWVNVSSAAGNSMSAVLDAGGSSTADEAVMSSGLAWTVIHVGEILNALGTNRVAIGPDVDAAPIPAPDVSGIVTAVLETPATAGHRWVAAPGDSGPRRAIRALLG